MSLQKGPGVDQILAVAPRFNVVDLSAELDSDAAFLDTAAIVSLVDQVITSDSAVAHLAVCWPGPRGSCCPAPPTGAASTHR